MISLCLISYCFILMKLFMFSALVFPSTKVSYPSFSIINHNWFLNIKSLLGVSRQEYWSGLPFPSARGLPTQGLKPGLLHCRQTLYWLSHQGSFIKCTMWKRQYANLSYIKNWLEKMDLEKREYVLVLVMLLTLSCKLGWIIWSL